MFCSILFMRLLVHIMRAESVIKNIFVRINFPGSSFLLLLYTTMLLPACAKIEIFEKNAVIPKHLWKYDLKPQFEFDVTDTVSEYNLYLVMRHTDAYGYNNIWLNLGSQAPADTMRFQRLELQLGSDAGGWEGSGMDDIWELRKPISRGPLKFNKAGKYKFQVEQIMRENPLPGIMSVGVRVEKLK